jgi:hypothetical protein
VRHASLQPARQASKPSRGAASEMTTGSTTARVWRNRFPSPQSHRVVSTELVAEGAREHADLTAVMGVVLHQIREHVDHSSRHPLHTSMTGRKGSFKQTCQIRSGLSQCTACFLRGDALFIQCRRTWANPTHSRERAPHPLNVRDDGRDCASTTPRRWLAPHCDWHHAREVLGHIAAVLERLDQFFFDFQWSASCHMSSRRPNGARAHLSRQWPSHILHYHSP